MIAERWDEASVNRSDKSRFFYWLLGARRSGVVTCIHSPWAPVDVADVPHYRPVTATSVPADGVAPMLDGLNRANVTVGSLDDCPWRGAVVTVRISVDDGTSQDVVLQCDTLSSPIDTVRWLAVDRQAEAAVLGAIARAQGR